VVCGDPTVRFYGKGYMNHPDHRVAADVALDAVFPSAETRLIFPELLAEGLEPHHVKRVFIHGARGPMPSSTSRPRSTRSWRPCASTRARWGSGIPPT